MIVTEFLMVTITHHYFMHCLPWPSLDGHQDRTYISLFPTVQMKTYYYISKDQFDGIGHDSLENRINQNEEEIGICFGKHRSVLLYLCMPQNSWASKQARNGRLDYTKSCLNLLTQLLVVVFLLGACFPFSVFIVFVELTECTDFWHSFTPPIKSCNIYLSVLDSPILLLYCAWLYPGM